MVGGGYKTGDVGCLRLVPESCITDKSEGRASKFDLESCGDGDADLGAPLANALVAVAEDGLELPQSGGGGL